MATLELRGDRVRLRRLEPTDARALSAVGADPAVARWWPGLNEEHLIDKADGRDGVVAFAVEHDGEVVGLAQAWEETDPEFRHAGIDVFLAPRVHGRGLGRDTVRTLAHWLIDERGHHRLTIDPALANERAIRCYEAVGFRRVGVLRRYWRGPDGEWRDGLLLELLADEL